MSRKKKVSYHIETIEKDDYVKYTGCSKEQVRWGNNDDPEPFLVQGGIYYVENTIVRSSHTKLVLRGVQGQFNSVSFERIGKAECP